VLDSDLFEGALNPSRGLLRATRQRLTIVGRSLWLRPGKTYLFGRTLAERMFYPQFTVMDRSENRFLTFQS
jgi:hypothetical protein